MKLTTLKSTLGRAPARLATLTARPDATPRVRGRKWMTRREQWLRAHPLCCDCDAEGRVTAGQEVDHVIPLWKGGKDDETNYATRCKDHHAAKTAREAAERGRGGSNL